LADFCTAVVHIDYLQLKVIKLHGYSMTSKDDLDTGNGALLEKVREV